MPLVQRKQCKTLILDNASIAMWRMFSFVILKDLKTKNGMEYLGMSTCPDPTIAIKNDETHSPSSTSGTSGTSTFEWLCRSSSPQRLIST